MNTEQQLLQDALNEIKSLRSQNQLMSARLGVYDEMMRLFNSTPNWSNGGIMHPDIAYDIEKYLKSRQQ